MMDNWLTLMGPQGIQGIMKDLSRDPISNKEIGPKIVYEIKKGIVPNLFVLFYRCG
jgi:hypothetical protein